MIKTFKKAFVAIIFTVGIQTAISAQTIDNIVTTLKSGNAAELSKYFQPNIDISLQNGSSSYNKSQAQQVLTNFFNKHPLKSFTVVHQGTSPEGAKYVVGTLVTADQTFRVYLYAVNGSGGLNVRELRFEEQ